MVSHWKTRSRWYPAETMTNANDADDLALLLNILAQVKSLRQSLKQAAIGIGLIINTNKIELMSLKQEVVITKSLASLWN